MRVSLLMALEQGPVHGCLRATTHHATAKPPCNAIPPYPRPSPSCAPPYRAPAPPPTTPHLCASGSKRMALIASLCRSRQKAMRAWKAACGSAVL